MVGWHGFRRYVEERCSGPWYSSAVVWDARDLVILEGCSWRSGSGVAHDGALACGSASRKVSFHGWHACVLSRVEVA
eukprot:10361597-Alexandrium_andersonii.AAC.1